MPRSAMKVVFAIKVGNLGIAYFLVQIRLLLLAPVITAILADTVVQVVFIIPNILLSGFIFPIANMPKAIQFVTYFLPMRYFLKIIRGIFMRGAGFSQHWDEALILLLWGVIVISIASLRLKKRLV